MSFLPFWNNLSWSLVKRSHTSHLICSHQHHGQISWFKILRFSQKNSCEHFILSFSYLRRLPHSHAAFVLGGLLLNLHVVTQPTVCNAWFVLPSTHPSLPLLVHHWPFIIALSQFKKHCGLTGNTVFGALSSAEKCHAVKQTSTNDLR